MTELQKTFDEVDPKGLPEPELDEDLHSTAEVLPPPSESTPLAVKYASEAAVKDASEYDIGSLPVASPIQEPFERIKNLGKKFITAVMEKRVLPYPVPTDNEGLQETLKEMQMSARRLRAKLDQASEAAVRMFFQTFSPVTVVKEFTEEDFRYWCDAYVNFLSSQPILGETASKAERQDFALRNILLSTIFRAAERRVDLATTLDELSARNQFPALFMNPELLPHQVARRCSEGDVTFEQFTRRLKALGAVGVAQQGDSGPTVPLGIAYDLADAAAFKKHYEESNLDVYQLFERFLASAEEAKIGRNDEGKSRVENMDFPESEVPFPLAGFAEALERAKLVAEADRLPLSEILNLRARWNAGTVSSAAMDVKFSHEGMVYNGMDVKYSALRRWGFSEDKDTIVAHLFTVAVFLL
ncbi:hypothetical protein, conserved [Eimeria acervulina]|uniref:Uncharacterized protein n=1 Tax=Eimeria acervulina TaxID=5801 RepID=U6GVM6_EIMAC|nr:hypothetical protein, conserved [Eimeria acervulina]CDI83343.1 hypothetical protein, conserved [Eimeria acervulina]